MFCANLHCWNWTAINAVAFIVLTVTLARVAYLQYRSQRKAFAIDLNEKRYGLIRSLQISMQQLRDENIFLFQFYNIPDFVGNPYSVFETLNNSRKQIEESYTKAEIWFDKDFAVQIQRFIDSYTEAISQMSVLISNGIQKSQTTYIQNEIRNIIYDKQIPVGKDKINEMIKIDPNLLENMKIRVDLLNRLVDEYNKIEPKFKNILIPKNNSTKGRNI